MSTVTTRTAEPLPTGPVHPSGSPKTTPPSGSRSVRARGWLSDADRRFWLVVLAVTALGSWLALHDLAGPSLWSDEVSSVAIAGGVGPALSQGIASDGGNMALYYLLLHVEINLAGEGPSALWLLSALATATTIPMTALVGRRLAGRRAALVAAAARLEPGRMLLVGGLAIAGLCSSLALLAAHRGTSQISWVAPVRLHTVLGAFAWLGSARAGPLAVELTAVA